jgi:hypothetical protein
MCAFSMVSMVLLSACGGEDVRAATAGCAAQLLSGDVVITEIMADPAGADDGFEWFEIYNASGVDLDLSGAVLRYRRVEGTGERGHVVDGVSVGAGDRVVVGDVLPTILPSHVDYGYGDALSLSNASGELSILCGEEVVDVAIYGEVSSGVSRGFDGTRTPDAVANDEMAAWCDARAAFAEEALGSPGAANEPCFGSTPATCIDRGRERATDPPRVGDLIVTEVMADPSVVDDETGEWIEVAVRRDVDLNGLGIGKRGEAPVDVVGSIECVRVQAGTHLLFAASDDEADNGGLPPRDHPLTLRLANTEGSTTPSVELRWGERVLDTVRWTKSEPGRALNLDPDGYDPAANDDAAAFCPAEQPYGAGDFGSPGATNHHCLGAGECREGGLPRPVRAPAAGDLFVTEIMPQPEAVAHADGEWFELRTTAAFDLNGLELGTDGAVEERIEAEDCLPVAAGDHLVFARNGDKARNGGLPRVDATHGFALANADAFFVGHGGVVLDEVVWTESSPGAARSLDDAGQWCDAVMPYGAGDLGTPGAANPTCASGSGLLCEDGGRLRAVVAPRLGDLVLVEVMADPRAVADERGEFFELLATADVDLDGLQIGRTPDTIDLVLPTGGPCLSVGAGARVVLARSDDPQVNGGVEGVLATFSFNLANGGGSLFVAHDGMLLDALTWPGSESGASVAVMPEHETPDGNDDAAHLCTSGSTYGAGDRGTPGAANACE